MAAISAFEQDLAWLLASINEANQDALASSATINWNRVQADVVLYFATLAQVNWQRNFALPLFNLMSERIEELNEEFEQGGPSPTEVLSEPWFSQYTEEFSEFINETSLNTITGIIEQAQQEVWSVPETIGNLEALYEQWTTGALEPGDFEWLIGGLPQFRAQVISENETVGGINFVSFRQYQLWGVAQHEWISQRDTRVRPAHASADGQIVNMGTPFTVGGEALMFPKDPRGSASNVINCRCFTRPVE